MIVAVVKSDPMPARAGKYYQIDGRNGKSGGSRCLGQSAGQFPNHVIDFKTRQGIIEIAEPLFFHGSARAIPKFKSDRLTPSRFPGNCDARESLAYRLISRLPKRVNPTGCVDKRQSHKRRFPLVHASHSLQVLGGHEIFKGAEMLY
jgi:hypothetical protein